jgi:hypothetical protein
MAAMLREQSDAAGTVTEDDKVLAQDADRHR